MGGVVKQYDIKSGKVFVFGSNLAGIHGAGAALYARKHCGAIQGIGEGPMPEHMRPTCYAIATKDFRIRTLPLTYITKSVQAFILYAAICPELEFFVTRIGCGLAGYKDHQIAPMFAHAPINCELPEVWR